MASDVLPSLSRMMIGFIGAVVIGVVVGFVLGQAHRLQAMFAPVLEFLRAIPAVALIPLVIIVLGLDDTAKVILITFICLWPVLLNTEAAIRGMDPGLRETARVYGIHWFRYELQVALPAAAPQIFAGMRTSLSLALIMVVVSEMMAGGNGIGVFVLQSQRSFAITDMWSGIVLIGIFGYVFNLLLIVVENRVLAWHHGANTAVVPPRSRGRPHTSMPPHHTRRTRRAAAMSVSGSPSTSTRSARNPGVIAPRSSSENACAAVEVAARSASAVDRPASTSRASSSCMLSPYGGNARVRDSM